MFLLGGEEGVEMLLVLDWLDWKSPKDGDAEKAITSKIVGSY